VRILVSGASGHVGGAIARHLVQAGHEVIGVSRRLNSQSRTLPCALAMDLGRPDAAQHLAAEQAPCQAIVHAAAALDSDPFTPSLSLTNGLGTQQILDLATRWSARSVVYISGVTVIGRPEQLPVTEQHPTLPFTAYHASKLYAEHLVRLPLSDTPARAVLRLSAPVGRGMDSRRILPEFIGRALEGRPLELAGTGTRGQDYVDARDVALAAEAAIDARAEGVFNVASGRCVTNHELAQICIEELGSSSEVRFSGIPDPDDSVRWEISIAQAERYLGYRPRHTLEESIAQVAESLQTRHQVSR
jgi:nucleoside-diphosphate-sugar epimerase